MYFNLLFVLLIVYFVLNYSNGQRDKKFFREDYKYIKASQAFYKIHTTPRTWPDAKRMCALEGASLFYPENDDETKAVLSYWTKTQPFPWVYRTIDGNSVSDVYNNWDPSVHKGNGGIENCVILKKDGTLSDHQCFQNYSFICKKSLASPKWDSKCKMPNLGYSYNEQVDRCFKFHPEPKTWRDAYAVCEAELSYLPVINNQEEADYLVKLTKNVLDGKCLREKVHFDSIYRDDEGCQDVPDGQRDKKFFREDYKYIKASQAFYKIHTTPRTWPDAKRMCALEGASLFYPENDDETKAVLSYWTETQPFPWVYIGVLKVEGVFRTIDGNSVSDVYNNWDPSVHKGNGGIENCVILKKNGTLSDHQCFQNYSFICKKSLASLKWDSTCKMPNLDYTHNEQLDRCYKFHLKPMSWTDAYETCSAEQSYLAVINSQVEADYLVKLTENAPKNQVKGKYLRGAVHLGFHNRNNDIWQTIRGTKLNDSGYVVWCRSQPDGGDQELCGSMFYSGMLNDIGCEQRCFFICEHERSQSSHLGRDNSLENVINANQNVSVGVMPSLNIFDLLLPPI